jgi:hypothetical protein
MESVAIPFQSIEDILGQEDLVALVTSTFSGNMGALTQLSLQPKHNPRVEAIDRQSLLKLFLLQTRLTQKLGIKRVVIGLNANTFDGDIKEARMALLGVTLSYQVIGEAVMPEAFSSINISTESPLLEVWADVRTQDHEFALGGRFIVKNPTQEDIDRAELTSRNGTTCALALFPWGIHFDHSTFNINDQTLKFSYAEFGDVLDEVVESGEEIKSALFRRVDIRRTNKKKVIAVHTSPT